MKKTTIVLCCIVLLTASLRMMSLYRVPEFSRRLPQDATQSIAAGEPLSSNLIDQYRIVDIQYQRFDPTAVVAVQAGADRLPGVAGTDDNINGIVDDRLELGATRSDDPCNVLTAEQLAQIPEENAMVLQRGAFVATEAPVSNGRCRATVFGKFENGTPWSLLVDLD